MNRYDELLTLNEYIEKNTDSAMWYNVNISPDYQFPIVKSVVEDWFQFRRITDNERFPIYFNRKVRLLQRQYSQLYRAEYTEIDPMVANYLEREVSFDRALEILKNSDANTSSTSNSDTTSTRTPNLKTSTTDSGTVNTDNTGTVKDVANSSISSDFNNDSVSDSTASNKSHVTSMNGKLPQNETYGIGFPAQLDWKNASEQNENDSTDSSTSNTTTNDTGHSTSDTDSTNTQTLNTQVLETRNLNGSSTTTGTDDTKSNISGTVTSNNKLNETDSHKDRTSTQEILTGRTGILPSQALESYRNYVYSTNAMEWLLRELEVCFMPEFD